MTEIIDDKLIQFKSIQDKYIKNIKNLNIDTQKKFFKYKEKPLEVIISSYDDMYDILYLKNKLSYLKPQELLNSNDQLEMISMKFHKSI